MFLSLVRFVFPLSAAIALAAPVQSVCASAAEEVSLETALSAYVDGLRTGSLKKLQELFAPDGQLCVVSAEPTRVDCKKFSEVLGGWVARPDPLTAGRIVHRNDATPSMTAVTYDLTFDGRRYLDQLLLYRIEGRWQVVAKTTTVQ